MSTGQTSIGKLSTLRFSRLLAQFWEQGYSGSFRARSYAEAGAAVTKEILLERGWIAWAASDNADESIRHYLLHRGILRSEQWRLAEEKAGSAQARRVLLNLGFLTARELQDADRERVTGIVLSLFTWRDGEYAIGPGSLPNGTPNLKIDPRDLVLEGLMSSGDRERVLEEIGSLDAVLVVRPDDLVRASLSLPVELVDLMGKADGTRTVAEICALSPQPDFLISAAFAALKALGLARPLEGDVTAAPPAPPRPHPQKGRSRRQGASWSPGEDSLQTPMLPLEESPPTAPVQVEAAARQPAEVGTIGSPEEAEEEAGTVPMRTPPGGMPAVASSPTGREEAPEEVLPESHAAAETVRMTAAIEEEAGTSPISMSPSEIRAVDASEENAADEAYRETDREGEVELTPGIPVTPTPPPPDASAPGDFAPEEIEDAVQLLSEQASEAAASPLESRMDRHEEESRDTEATDAATFESERAQEEPLSGEESLEEPGVEEGGPEEEVPGWVYKPSGPPSETERTGRRWPIWTAVAAFSIVVAMALMLVFRDTAPDYDEFWTPAQAGDAAEAPAVVDLPETTATEPTESSGGVATASLTEGSAPSAAAGPSGASTDPQGTTGDSTPAGPRAPQPTAPKPATLAPTEPEGIFQGGAFREARGLLVKGRLREAARRFDSALGARDGLYTIQLAVACEPGTVNRAIGTTRGASEFFILPKILSGRECYRLLWGRYADRTTAEKARSSVPRAFLKDRNPPFPSPL
jgi:hypothetical protein